MPIKREFLNWGSGALHAAACYLFQRYESADGLVDLSETLVVLPSSRAGRRLREILIEQAERQDAAMFPPQITTMGALPEFLYELKRPFASPLIQQLAWAQALRRSDRRAMSKVIADLPADRDDPRWLELGSLLHHQHRELAGDGLNFSMVAEQCRGLMGTNESSRWKTLARVQQVYLQLLDDLGLWDRQTARLFAVQHQECNTDRDIVLLCTVDMNSTSRAMIDQVATRVTALVYAPTEQADRFDSHGCVDPSAWQDVHLSIDRDQIIVADGPSNQADGVVHAVDALDGKYRADEITIGVPDVSLVPHIETKLHQVHLSARWGPGRPLSVSRPVQMLRCVADYVRRRSFRDLAECARHPDIEQWLIAREQHDVLEQLDRYFESHLPERVPTSGHGPGEVPPAALALDVLLGPLCQGHCHPSDWSELLIDLLATVYGDHVVDPDQTADRTTLQACEQLQQAIATLRELPETLAPEVSSAAAILMALGQIEQSDVPSSPEQDAIQMLGWLELTLDDAPVLIVTSLNEGVVPQSVNSDLFLPNRLRSQLGIDDNQRRYARDAYALQVLLSSRKHLRLIVGRRTAEGDPLSPSRLLFATDEAATVDRCLRLFNPDAESEVRPIVTRPSRADSGFFVPRPQPLDQPITRLSATDFRSYLDCPYRFYLERVLRLSAVRDDTDEIDAPHFGTLAHDVLSDFGQGPCRHSAEADEIKQYLLERLDERARQQFGRRPSPAVQVQVAQLRLRLVAMAAAQAKWRLRGWRITEHVEAELSDDGVPFDVDGQPILLRGRIDRIDVHEQTGEYAVLDYKTGESGETPEKKHRAGGKKSGAEREWIDLQLPLYRHLARGMSVDGKIRLGYILLPKNTQRTGFCFADWTEEELTQADDVARTVVRCIRQEIFWPPTQPPPRLGTDLAPICQEGVFDRQLQEAATS